MGSKADSARDKAEGKVEKIQWLMPTTPTLRFAFSFRQTKALSQSSTVGSVATPLTGSTDMEEVDHEPILIVPSISHTTQNLSSIFVFFSEA